jgi:F-type H+-transporting ATPase subunit b
MPQLDLSSFSSQIFWLLVIFVTLYLLLSRLTIPGISEILVKRETIIASDLNQADKASRQAAAIENEYEISLAEAKKRSMDLIFNAESNIKDETHKAMHELDEILASELREAENEIDSLKADLQKTMDVATTEIIQALVTKLINVAPDVTQIQSVIRKMIV